MMKARFFVLLIGIILLQGCSSPFLNRPVIEDKVGKPWYSSSKGIGTLAITAERKVVVMNFKNNRFCTEPPQDFGQAIKAMAEIIAAYKREKPKDALGTSHNADLSFKNSMETTLKEVAKQPYGIMFLRYQSAFLCQMFANNALSKDDYLDFADKTMNQANEILGKEVDLELFRAKAELAASKKQEVKEQSKPITFSLPRLVMGSDAKAIITTTVDLPAKLMSGFYELALGFRKYQTLKAYNYKKVNTDDGVVLDSNHIVFTSAIIKPVSGSFASGDILEASIRVVSVPGYEPRFDPIPQRVVFYNAGDEKIKLDDKGKKLEWSKFEENKELVFNIPKHVSKAYKDFNNIRKLFVQVLVKESDERFEVGVKLIKRDEKQWAVKLRLDEDNQKAFDKLHKDHKITLSFVASQIKSLDLPEIDGDVTIAKKES